MENAVQLGGWWRLWIALAALYGVLVSLIAYNQWPTTERTHHHPAYLYQMSPEAQSALIRNVPMKTLVEMLNTAAKAENLAQAKEIAAKLEERHAARITYDPINLEMPNSYVVAVSGDISKADSSLIGREYVRVLREQLPDARLKASGEFFLIWLLPCVLSAALGLLFRWVYRGFKKNKP